MKRHTLVGALGVAALLAAATPGIAGAANGGLFSGTYAIAPYGDIVHVSSKCPECDAVGTGATGTGTPTVVADGYVQELTLVSVGTCPAANTTAIWTRVGP